MATPEKDFNGKNINKKVDEMKKVTQEARKLFNLPDNETVIECFSSGLLGKLYVTQNFIGYKSGSTLFSFPFHKVKAIRKVKGGVEIEEKKVYSVSLSKTDEAFDILDHLYKHIPTYTKKTEREELLGEGNGEGGGIGEMAGELLQLSNPVNTGATKNALRKMYEAQQMGVAGLEELARQEEVLNNINDNLDNIDFNLSKNERHLRAIEGAGGSIKNAFSRDPKKGDYSYEREAAGYEIKQIKKPELKISILYKHKNGKMTPSTLVMKEKGFMIFKQDTETLVEEKPIRTAKKYEELEKLVMRARHQHMDIWFSGGRFRLMSSYLQAITNEMFLRHPKGQIPVEFEPGVVKFDFGSPSIGYSFGGRNSKSGGKGENTIESSSLISKNAPKHVKQALAEQDKDLDELARGLDHLQGIAITMNEELVKSDAQIGNLGERIDRSHQKMASQQHRMNNILDS